MSYGGENLPRNNDLTMRKSYSCFKISNHWVRSEK